MMTNYKNDDYNIGKEAFLFERTKRIGLKTVRSERSFNLIKKNRGNPK